MNRLSVAMAAVILLIVAGTGSHCVAQTYDFQNFTVENGLSQSQILALFQDDYGELWIGTNQGGLNRYDGRSFKVFNKDNGLIDNLVFSLGHDHRKRLAIGTAGGLTIMDGRKFYSLDTTDGLPHNGVLKIFTDLAGTTWIGTGKGLAKMVGDSVRPFPLDTLLDKSTILNIRQGADANLWFCTVQNGVFRWDGVSVKRYGTEQGLPMNYVFDVLPMADSAWVFNYRGLFKLRSDTLTELKGPSLKAGTIYYSYTQDRSGNIWLGTSTGVLKYNGRTYQSFSTENGLVDNNIWKLLEDREGNMWFASKTNGVSKLNSERLRIFDSEELFPFKAVNSVFTDNTGKVWIGTKRTVVRFENGRFETIGKTTIDVHAIQSDGKGGLWLGTHNAGLVHYDGNKFKTHLTPEAYGDASRIIYALHVEGDNVLQATKRGLWIYDGKKYFRPKGAENYEEPVYDIQKDAKGRLWCGYENGALLCDSSGCRQLTKETGLFNGRCRSVRIGPDGKIWFGTNDGVVLYDGDTARFIGSKKDGLFSDAVYSLCFDTHGSLWVGQSRGVCRLMIDDDGKIEVKQYGRQQGFRGLGCSNNAMTITPQGQLFIGTSNGLVMYDPSLDFESVHRPITRLISVRLFNSEEGLAAMSDSVSNAGLPIGLKLPFNQNHLTFRFTGVSLTSPDAVYYSHFLEGFDENWSEPSNSDEAVYANLPHGKYTFRVKSGYGTDLTDSPEVTFSFEIDPPFYKTKWFYGLCIVIGIGFAYSYYAIRRANTQITRQKEEIEVQKSLIERKNVEVMDSINYARTIQEAILPSDQTWAENVGESFVLYMPKDIVSGDFYWTEKRGSSALFAAVDCTGHGVPGAFMSIIGHNGLNSAVNEHRLTRPDVIMNFLNMTVNEALRKRDGRSVKDGMDMALCLLDRAKAKVDFAGAYNPMYLIRGGDLQIFKGERRAVGTETDSEHGGFKMVTVEVKPGDMIYVFSDGFSDQFGGPQGKKLKSSGFRDLLLSVYHQPMEVQKMRIRQFFFDWKGDLEQVDDVCVIGVRV